MLPMLCVVYILSGIPGVGTADLYPSEGGGPGGCEMMGDQLNYLLQPIHKIAFSRFVPNKSVPDKVDGKPFVRLRISMDPDSKAHPLDPAAQYVENLP
jgi:hypothetical protein